MESAVRAIQTNSHELWSKIVNSNLDLNSVSETDITVAILKKKQTKTNKQTNKNHDSHLNKIQTISIQLNVKQCDTIRLLLPELIAKTELRL